MTQGEVVFHRVKDLTKSEFDRYKGAYDVLDDILVANLFTYYVVAVKSLVKMWQEANEELATSPLPISGGKDYMIELSARLRGAVLSLVSMLCYHQERTYEELCEKYENNGPEHLAAKQIFGKLFDDYFGYRYLYLLRNIMIHDTMFAVSITGEAYANNGNPFGVINLDLDRSVFLDSEKIKAPLKAELASKPGDPSIIQMFMEIHREMRTANRKLLTILHPDLTSVCETVLEFDALFDGRDGTRGLIHQASPELRAPFTTGFTAWAGDIIMFARSYTTEDWLSGNVDTDI